MRLGAARRRLEESSGQSDAIEALREIVSNLLGSEEIALFEVDRKTADMRLLWSFGIDAAACNPLRALHEVGLQRMAKGECHVEMPADDSVGSAAKTQAFVPLRMANHTVAVLAILRLLPQKLGFDRPDMDLLSLLSEEAGKALFGSIAKPPTEKPEMRT
ncbi:MAG: hypothetical protein ACLP72_07600 [Candidatus Sulfotelmatobacter sp.]